ncbi:hypothetical protein [Longimicrobium sp.]|uniref:hypothetical protein n=1 Tax=Longimicrobium sp. TaxID=2029185 RepID=UPI002E378F13|nr:hypothetical protein [Longimicrobium sp.]HEX6038038.1 hypothetical protein [Longimicrobium sp.]
MEEKSIQGGRVVDLAAALREQKQIGPSNGALWPAGLDAADNPPENTGWAYCRRCAWHGSDEDTGLEWYDPETGDVVDEPEDWQLGCVDVLLCPACGGSDLADAWPAEQAAH